MLGFEGLERWVKETTNRGFEPSPRYLLFDCGIDPLKNTRIMKIIDLELEYIKTRLVLTIIKMLIIYMRNNSQVMDST